MALTKISSSNARRMSQETSLSDERQRISIHFIIVFPSLDSCSKRYVRSTRIYVEVLSCSETLNPCACLFVNHTQETAYCIPLTDCPFQLACD